MFRILLVGVLSLCVSTTAASSGLAMMNFYQMTGGPRWHKNSGWDALSQYSDPCQFELFGVTCDANGVSQINLRGNNLGGVLPSNADFFDLLAGSLTTLLLHNNPNLGGPPPVLKDSYVLNQLDLSFCGFTGALNTTLFSRALQNLNVQANFLNGKIPENIGTLSPNLQFLYLGNNTYTHGEVPRSICDLHGLLVFDVMLSKITGLPDCFGEDHKSLQVLNLFSNSIRGYIPESWCKMVSLKVLQVQENYDFGGYIPPCIGNWTQLDTLAIENTKVEGTIPEVIFNMTELQNLILSLSRFHGPIPDKFHNLTKLEVVTLNGNPTNPFSTYNGTIPTSLMELPNLRTLSMQYTDLIGPVPYMGKLKSLWGLSLSNNYHLASPFPIELLNEIWHQPTYNKYFVRELHLENSRFYGSLPRDIDPKLILNISTLPNSVTLYHNDWDGYIPDVTLDWIPNASWPGTLRQCLRLLFPIHEKFLPLTWQFKGTKLQVGSMETNVFSMLGGDVMSIQGSNLYELLGEFRCGFCLPYSLYDNRCVNETTWTNTSRVVAFTAAAYDKHNDAMNCLTPAIHTNKTIMVAFFYHGPAGSQNTTGNLTTKYISNGWQEIKFYNPYPTVTHLSPSQGRVEGCTLVTLHGTGFLNAPNPYLGLNVPLFVHAKQQQGFIDRSTLFRHHNYHGGASPQPFETLLQSPPLYVQGSIVSDTQATFRIPFADPSNYTFVTYASNYSLYFPLPATLFPNGLDHANQHSAFNRDATYEFASESCDSILMPCRQGYEDPEHCDTPVCRCHSTGICNHTTDICQCSNGFTGSWCEECLSEHWGKYCSPCVCDHGRCADGINNDGSCDCDSAYMGERCNISKIAVGVGAGASLVVIIIVLILFKKRAAFGVNTEGGKKGKKKKKKKKSGSKKKAEKENDSQLHKVLIEENGEGARLNSKNAADV